MLLHCCCGYRIVRLSEKKRTAQIYRYKEAKEGRPIERKQTQSSLTEKYAVGDQLGEGGMGMCATPPCLGGLARRV
jgi:hypothetical protein